LVGRRLCSDVADGLDGNLLRRRGSKSYTYSDADRNSDSYSNRDGNAYCNPNSNADCDSSAFADPDTNR